MLRIESIVGMSGNGCDDWLVAVDPSPKTASVLDRTAADKLLAALSFKNCLRLNLLMLYLLAGLNLDENCSGGERFESHGQRREGCYLF